MRLGTERLAALSAPLLAVATLASCISVQYRGADGRPRVRGVAFREKLDLAEGELHTVRTPGFALRLWPGPVGISLGFAEELVFLAEAEDGDAVAVGFQHRVFGLAVSSESFAVGFDRTFLITEPPATALGVVQAIHYDATRPSKTIVYRRHQP